jgi:hypothetical protein
MRRSPAAKATDAAEALLDWLATRPQAQVIDGRPAAGAAGVGADQLLTPAEPTASVESTDIQADIADPAPVAALAADSSGLPALRLGQADRHAPLRLASSDWLHHRLAITGPAGDVASFRQAAAGAGTVPWHLDLERVEEDCFHLLVAPPAPHQRTLSLEGARILAGQLREAAGRRHALAVARVGHSTACPFDLHALVPVPEDVLHLGPDDVRALAWLWEHWGTTQTLRHVTEEKESENPAGLRLGPGEAAFCLTFWSADWTPWRALASVAARWPSLRFDARPSYDAK